MKVRRYKKKLVIFDGSSLNNHWTDEPTDSVNIWNIFSSILVSQAGMPAPAFV